MWRGEAKSLPDALADFRRRWGNRFDSDLGPTPSRTEAVVSVERRPIAFDVLSQPDHWVGRAKVGNWTVTIEGHEFGLEGLELVEITDLKPYILGSRRFEGTEEA